MSKLMKLNDIQDDKFLNDLFNNELIVFEDIQGSKIYVNWNGKDFTIRVKSISNDPINLIDLAMQNYYNRAIEFFNSLDLKSNSFSVNKLISKLRKDFFPKKIPLVLKSKSTIDLGVKIVVSIESNTVCLSSLLKLQTILFQFSSSSFGETHA